MLCLYDALVYWQDISTIYEFRFLQNRKRLMFWIGVTILLFTHDISELFRGIRVAMTVIVFWKIKLSYAKWLEKLNNISFGFFIVQHIVLLALNLYTYFL